MTRNRLSIIPVFIALIFNLVVPVVSIAVPEAIPSALAPQVATAASDPIHVSFTLEGCRNPSVNLEDTGFICADADYTTGNLGKTWNELDLVPYRLHSTVGTQADATTTYTLGIAADHKDGGAPGYDVMTAPVVNVALSDASCSVSGGDETVIAPGVGGTDESIGRLFTISQDKGTTCVFDWVERLALGSHLFPGSSLHTNRTNQAWSTSGIGAADVSIPVKEILPQELSKDMSAEQGQAYAWAVEKSADPGSLNFQNTCLDTAGARSAQVEITVSWTRSGPTASGDTTITTHVYATNPAHRTITVQATDKIYAGAGQDAANLLESVTGSAVDVPAAAEDMLVLTHSFVYGGDATTFNDVATATYTDKVTGIAVPGQTSATASATTVPSDAGVENASVLVTDTESITGTGLSFSVAQPSLGAFTNYAADSSTTGPVDWEFTATNSGSVTFTKTVTVDEPRITSGDLSDTATIVGDAQLELDSASANVEITTDAMVGLQINKTIPSGSLRSGESVTFDFAVTGPDGFADTASITFSFGDALTKSTSLSGLAPGEYTVSEQPQANWADHSDQSDTITLPDCDGSVSFNNSTLAPDLDLLKAADDETVTAGDQIGFAITLTNSGPGIAKDVTLDDALPFGTGVDWEIDSVAGIGGFDPTGLCAIVGSPSDEDLDCDLGDLAAGEGLTVNLVSDTTGESCKSYENQAAAAGSNHEEITSDDTTTVLCPDITVDKTAADEAISAGEDASFTVVTSNAGDGVAYDAELSDDLPAVANGWAIDSEDWAGDCTITGDAGDTQTLECGPEDVEAGGSRSVTVTSTTVAADCGLLENLAVASASNEASDDTENNSDDASILVECPGLNIVKTAIEAEIVVGDENPTAGFEITVWNAGPGEAFDVVVHDDLPAGLVWDVEIQDPDGDDACMVASSAVLGSEPTMSFDCSFGTLPVTEIDGGKVILVTAVADRTDCGLLENLATADASNGDPVSDDAEISVRCPELVLDKVASTELITITGPDNSLVATPSVVTWTLTYTLTDGPVTNAVITDEIPDGFEFLDASNGGTLVDGAVSWTFPTLTESGSVTFRTTVDTATISRAAPTVNVAVIDSDETPEDEGEDSVSVTQEGELGGNPTPRPSLPDTAAAIGPNGEAVTVPIELLVAFFIGSLGALTLANVKARNRRR